MARARGKRPTADQLQAARLAVLAAALLGRAIPDCVRRRQAENRAGLCAPRSLARARRLQAERLTGRTARGGHRLARDEGSCQRPRRATRDEHDAAMGRLLLVLPAVHRSRQRGATRRPGARALLDAGGPLHRRRRACRAASALRAVLAQGAVRRGRRVHARAVRQARASGHDLGRARVHELRRCTRQRRVRGSCARRSRHAHGRASSRAERAGRSSGEARRALRVARVAEDRRRIARIQDEQEPRQRRESRRHHRPLRHGCVSAVRNVPRAARARKAVEHARRRRHLSIPESRVAAHRRRRRRKEESGTGA